MAIKTVTPLVSVCIPTYNRSQSLRRAVEAVLNGSYPNVEIIISDNASPDQTEVVCREISRRDHRVKYFRHSVNAGAAKNFQFAREQASGKYFLWHGDDDVLGPEYISMCVAKMEQDESLVLVSGVGAYRTDAGQVTHLGNVIQLDSNFPMLRVMKYLWHVADNSVFCGVYRADSSLGCRMPNILAGDWAWVAAILLRGRCVVLPSVRVYRQYEKSTSSSYERIIHALGASNWQARYPRIASSKNVAVDLVFHSGEYANRSLHCKLLDFSLVFATLILKSAWGFMRQHLSGVSILRAFYQKYVKPPPSQ